MRKIGTSVPAWPFGPVSVSVQKLSPASLALSPFPASPWLRLPESPQWDFHPSGFLLLLQNHAFSKAPWLHGRYPASTLLQASATHGYAFPLRVGSAPPRRASQVPRL